MNEAILSLFPTWSFFLGVCIGSFLNVLVIRLEKEESVGGRSHCLQCKKTLHWYELIPVFSFLFLRARCLTCHTPLSWQYPLVELVTGLLFLGIALITPLPLYLSLQTLILFIAMASLVSLVAYDIRHTIIPDRFVYTFNLCALASVFVVGNSISLTPDPLLLLSGALSAFPFALLWVVSKGRWIGFGDAKLALGMGWFLGITGAFSAIMLAFWIGAVISAAIIGIQKMLFIQQKSLARSKPSLTIGSEIPFAPFLALGFLLVYFFSINAFTLPLQLFFWY